jgi:hypothetical protein
MLYRLYKRSKKKTMNGWQIKDMEGADYDISACITQYSPTWTDRNHKTSVRTAHYTSEIISEYLLNKMHINVHFTS